MSRSLSARSLTGALVLLVFAAAGVLVGAPAAVAADASPGVPSAHDLPGPAPTCVPEVEPNDRPEDAPIMSSAVCLTGVLPELRDQDLVLWDVEPAEALITWRITVAGVPTTITSVHLFEIRTEPGVYPVDAREFMRVDSAADPDVPGVKTGVSLKAGRYLLGISRGYPADRNPNPPGGYRVTIEREQPLPADGDVEPNDDTAGATPVSNPVALIGKVVDGNQDLYRWTVAPDEAASLWQLDIHGVTGDLLGIRLLDAAGGVVATAEMVRDGAAHLYDLRLAAGEYLVELTSSTDGPVPYVLTSQPSADLLADAEPNDDAALALPMEIGQEVTGRLTGPRDLDQYRFAVPQTLVASQHDVALRVASSQERRLCLVGPDQREIQCRQGQGDIVLSNLSLVAGEHSIVVSGNEDLDSDYRLSVSDAGPIVTDREVEPNDTTATASAFDPAVVMRGRSHQGDLDYYRITVTGDPQVWRLDATGSGIRSMYWLEPDLQVRGVADIAADGTRASLWDMYLIPGEHWIAFESRGDDYTLTMTPLGPRAAGSEREPNNVSENAEPLAIGEARTGRLPGAADTDVVRFSLQAPEHVAIHIDPPADGGVKAQLLAGGLELMRLREPVDGQPFVYDAMLQVGDYELWLSSDSGSVQPYRLLVERQDPFLAPADLEPNDTVATARDLPADLVVEGTGWGAGEDDDWYRIPAPADPATPLVVVTEGSIRHLELTDGTHGIGLDADADRTTWTSRPLPTGVPLYLHVAASGDYRLVVSGAGSVATNAPAVLPLQMVASVQSDQVAAYELFGQRVPGTLTLTNTGGQSLGLIVDGRTSDDTWAVRIPWASLTVAPGASVNVPLDLVVPADAWAGVPTRLTLRAMTADGRQQTAFVDVTPDRDAAAVGPEQAWLVPDTLLGGLDAASLALGATVIPFGNVDAEEQLHDGLALASAGYNGGIGDEPVTFTVDLATDDLVPVRGLIVDPLAGTPVLAATPRHFDLLLSQDGVTYDVVLSDELSPRQEDQYFVLDEQVPARFAQLRIHDTWGGRGSLQIGEWQVIATPGWAPAEPINIAAPANGGHLVFADPGQTDPRQGEWMLTEELESNSWLPYLDADIEMSWVIGFREGRTAQITELQWVDPPASDPAQRFERVQVEVSTDAPLGPWQDLGTWELTRAADGTVPPFRIDRPTWARYIRFTGEGPTGTKGYRETPGTLRVIERATDDTYRSIMGAWGRNRPEGIAELLEPPDLSAVSAGDLVSDGNDTADTATPLVIDVPQDGLIQRGKDVDWYQLTVPAGQNTLRLSLAAPAAAGIEPTLYDSAGVSVELVETTSSEPGVLRYVADVVPGATYRVSLEQPPFSTVFTYDTSGSMGTFLAYVSGALRSFVADVTPGEEAVMVQPFEESTLLDHWSDDAWEIEGAFDDVFGAIGSSAAETSMLAALQELETRPGAHALLVITDAETMSYNRAGDLWRELGRVRPTVFTVHVNGGGAPQLTTDLMQDWAHSWGGHYEYAASHGQIDRAFDRLATWMRRPTSYTIGYGTTFVDHTPGRLTVSPPPGAAGDQSVVAGSGVGVEILLDTSGSMTRKIGKKTRIDIAKSVLTSLVSQALPAGLPVALRIFDPRVRCGSTLLAPMAPLDPASMTALVKGIKIAKGTRTPLAATLQQLAGDLGHSEGPKIIVLVTDGQESCEGDPGQVIEDLVAGGLDVRVNIVGFAIDDEGLKAQIEHWAEVGHGQAFDAQGSNDLAAGIASALRAPFQVYDEDDQLVATGVVGGDPVQLPPGTYRVEVLTDPVMVFEDVGVAAGQSLDIPLEAAAPPP